MQENKLLLSYLQVLYILLLTKNVSLESKEYSSKMRPGNLKITKTYLLSLAPSSLLISLLSTLTVQSTPSPL